MQRRAEGPGGGISFMDCGDRAGTRGPGIFIILTQAPFTLLVFL